jgi:hypothetical protein
MALDTCQKLLQLYVTLIDGKSNTREKMLPTKVSIWLVTCSKNRKVPEV